LRNTRAIEQGPALELAGITWHRVESACNLAIGKPKMETAAMESCGRASNGEKLYLGDTGHGFSAAATTEEQLERAPGVEQVSARLPRSKQSRLREADVQLGMYKLSAARSSSRLLLMRGRS
jgi:hypothetical protein